MQKCKNAKKEGSRHRGGCAFFSKGLKGLKGFKGFKVFKGFRDFKVPTGQIRPTLRAALAAVTPPKAAKRAESNCQSNRKSVFLVS